MSSSAIGGSPTNANIQRPAGPPKAAAPAQTQAAQPTPQADKLMTLSPIGTFSPPTKFKTIDDYKAYVKASPVVKLPAYEKQLTAAQGALDQAQQTLKAHEVSLNYDGLKSARDGAAANLDSAQHPMRGEAQKTRAQAEQMKPQMDDLAKQISRLNNMGTVNNAVAGYSAYNTVTSKTGSDAAINGLLAVANAASAASEKKHAAELSAQLAELQAEYGAQLQAAVQMEHTPGDPAKVSEAQQNLNRAQAALDAVEPQLAPDRDRVQRAQTTRDQASASVDNLNAAKQYLTDYSENFSMITRFHLPKGYQQDLDTFWKGLN